MFVVFLLSRKQHSWLMEWYASSLMILPPTIRLFVQFWPRFFFIFSMPYTEATIREALRLKPIVVMALTHRCTKAAKLGDYWIPEVHHHKLISSYLFPQSFLFLQPLSIGEFFLNFFRNCQWVIVQFSNFLIVKI